ncbi:MAG: hypothetical protein ACRENE_26890 [Polyangiaceae bacterium]
MIDAIERLKVRLAVSLGWSSPAKVGEVIRGFQSTEADGVWHIYRGMRSISDPKERAIAFGHCLEEEAHADAFARVYRHYEDRAFSAAHFERKAIYEAGEPAWKTLAFVHVGEVDATRRFRLLREVLPEGPLKECLGTVISDEEGHVDLTNDMLKRMGATDGAIRRQVVRVRLQRLWQGWLRVGRRAVDTLATVTLSLVYYVFGALLAGAARRKLAAGFVTHDNSRLKRL